MNLTRALIRRPLLTTMAFAGIGLLGLVAALQLPVSELPDIDFPAIVVQVSAPGTSTTAVREQITQPVQQAVAQVNGVTELTAASQPGSSTVVAQLDAGVDVDATTNEVAQAVNRIQRQLPATAQTPQISKINPTATPLLVINYTGASAEELYRVANDTVLPRLQLVPGVGQANLRGGLQPRVTVILDPQLVAARGLGIAQITQALAQQNIDLPAGDVTAGSTRNQITVGGEAVDAAAIGDAVVGSSAGASVRLREVATIGTGTAEPTSTSSLDGAPTVSIAIQARVGANDIDTAAAVRRELDAIDAALPSGVHRTITLDQTVFTKAALSSTVEDLALAVILASLVIIVFLRDLRQTMIVFVAIPAALLATTLMMYLLRFSLDTVSLLSLSLLIGILVDDAVVVIENITRHLRLGKPPADAALHGRMEIGAAAIALTLTDVVVFLPVVFAGGVVGRVLIEFGLTVVAATLFSLLVSFTLTPMLAAHWLRRTPSASSPPAAPYEAPPGGAGGRVLAGYERVLRASLRARPLVVAVAVAAAALSGGLVATGVLGTDYVPQQDNGVITVNARMPPGTSLSTTAATLDDLGRRIRATLPEVTHVQATAGGGRQGSADTGSMTIILRPKEQRSLSLDAARQRITGLASNDPGLQVTTSVRSSFAAGGGAGGLPVILRGPDPDLLDSLAEQAAAKLRTVRGVGQVQSSAAGAAPVWELEVDQDLARRYGLTNQQISDAVSTAVDGKDVTSVRTSTGQTPVRVAVAGGPTMTEDQLLRLPIVAAPRGGSAGAPANAVILGQVASVGHSTSPQTINEFNRLPQVTLTVADVEGVPLSKVRSRVVAAMRTVDLPPGYSYVLGGAANSRAPRSARCCWRSGCLRCWCTCCSRRCTSRCCCRSRCCSACRWRRPARLSRSPWPVRPSTFSALSAC